MKQPFEKSVPSLRELIARIEDLEIAKTSLAILIASPDERRWWAMTWVTPVESLISRTAETYNLDEYAESGLPCGASPYIRENEGKQRALTVLATTVQMLAYLPLQWFNPSFHVPDDFDPETTILYTYHLDALQLGLRMYERSIQSDTHSGRASASNLPAELLPFNLQRCDVPQTLKCSGGDPVTIQNEDYWKLMEALMGAYPNAVPESKLKHLFPYNVDQRKNARKKLNELIDSLGLTVSNWVLTEVKT